MDEKKVRKAIEIFKGIEEVRGNLPEDGNDIEEAFYTAIEALEKQLPKKPIVYSEYKGEIDFDCPDCGKRFVAYKDDMICCPYCACKFDWSEC